MKKPLSKTAVVFILHSIPYGKGKAEPATEPATEPVSIPYGKGKVETQTKVLEYETYQSPMGKVKTTTFIEMKSSASMYQSPMGKVKTHTHYPSKYPQKVSIPYGKGKVGQVLRTGQCGNVSIPYGKGKEKQKQMQKQKQKSINPLWER